MTLAHAGHWLVNLIYVAPLLFVIAVIVRDKLKHRHDDEAPEPAPEQPG